MKILIIAILMALIMGCGKKDDPVPSKNLFSSWVNQKDSSILDLTKDAVGANSIQFMFSSGAYCSCSMLIGGDSSSGAMNVSGCTFVANGTTATDPGCAQADKSNKYTNSAATLSVCDADGTNCDIYK